MKIVVRNPAIKIQGSIPEPFLYDIQKRFGVSNVEIVGTPVLSMKPGERLKALRELHGMTLEELGKRLGGVTRMNVSAMESGRRKITRARAEQIVKIFSNITVETLMENGDGKTNT